MADVRTRDEAIASVDGALQTWSTSLTAILTQAQAVARGAKDEIESIARQRANEVAAIEALLGSAGGERGRQLRAELVRATEAYERARRAGVKLGDVAASVSQLNRSHATTSTSQVATARVQLSAMSRALEGYRAGAVGFDGAASGGARFARATTDSFEGMGLTDVNVRSADLAENPILDDNISQGTFGKGGLSRADYRWAVQTWNDTVGPGIASGQTREDFAARDARSNAPPLRRIADVYDIFLGASRIRVDQQPDGSLNVVNGRHRLVIARELGIKSLPGQVSQ